MDKRAGLERLRREVRVEDMETEILIRRWPSIITWLPSASTRGNGNSGLIALRLNGSSVDTSTLASMVLNSRMTG